MYESACCQCEHCIREEIVSPGPGCQPGLYERTCDEGSVNFMSADGCWQFEKREEEP